MNSPDDFNGDLTGQEARLRALLRAGRGATDGTAIPGRLAAAAVAQVRAERRRRTWANARVLLCALALVVTPVVAVAGIMKLDWPGWATALPAQVACALFVLAELRTKARGLARPRSWSAGHAESGGARPAVSALALPGLALAFIGFVEFGPSTVLHLLGPALVVVSGIASRRLVEAERQPRAGRDTDTHATRRAGGRRG